MVNGDRWEFSNAEVVDDSGLVLRCRIEGSSASRRFGYSRARKFATRVTVGGSSWVDVAVDLGLVAGS
jgi:hypothetical protein